MDKSKATEKLKREYEKVYESPLNWCPLFGYMPELSRNKITKTIILEDEHGEGLSVFDILNDTHECIKDAREYWGIHKSYFNLTKYNPKPDVKLLLSRIEKKENNNKHNQINEKIYLARFLFGFLGQIVLSCYPGLDKDVYYNTTLIKRGCCDVLTIRPKGLLLSVENYINMGKGAGISLSYKYHIGEIYALYAIYESWLLINNLLNKKYTQKDEETIFDYNRYIDSLLSAAEDQKEKRKLIIENELRGMKLEIISLNNKYKQIVRWKKDKPKIDKKHQKIIYEADTMLKNIKYNPNSTNKFNATEIAKNIKKKLNSKLTVNYISKIISPIVKKEKITYKRS